MKKLTKMLISALTLTAALAAGAVASASDGAAGGEAAAGGGGFFDPTMIIIMVGMIAVFYFLMIRPENKKKKKLAEMRSSLAVGDHITTIGGIIGKVVSLDEEKVTFETGEDRVRMQVTKWAISTVSKSSTEVEPASGS